jgi:hypothetical protein
MLEVVHTSKTSVNSCQSTRRYNLDTTTYRIIFLTLWKVLWSVSLSENITWSSANMRIFIDFSFFKLSYKCKFSAVVANVLQHRQGRD